MLTCSLNAQIIQLFDNYTNENVSFQRISNIPVSSLIDGVLYIRKNGNYYKRIINNNEINILSYGVKNDGSNQYAILKKVADIARNEKINLYFPAGSYNCGNSNFPFRTDDLVQNAGLKSYNNIIIRGDFPSTIFKTTSVSGADVLQLNSISDITFKDLVITATVENKDFKKGGVGGSNGISITNGFNNITLDNIYVHDLDYVEHPLYIDGGKALTIQDGKFSTNINGKLIAKRIESYNNPYGFMHDGYLSKLPFYSLDINIDMYIEKAYVGFYASFDESDKPYNDKNYFKYNVNVFLKDCQRDIILNRLYGGNVNFGVYSNESDSDLKKNAKGNLWISSITKVLTSKNSTIVSLSYVKNSNVKVSGFKNQTDTKYIIGTPGNIPEAFGNPYTENSIIRLNVGGSAITPLSINEYLGLSIRNSTITIDQFTGILPPKLFSRNLKNNIVLNSIKSNIPVYGHTSDKPILTLSDAGTFYYDYHIKQLFNWTGSIWKNITVINH